MELLPALEVTKLVIVDGAVVSGITFTVKVREFDSPPPGVGLKTVTGNVPALVRSLVGIVAVSWVESTNVVVRSEPLNLTTDDEIKFVPLTVIVKPGSPTSLEVGDMPVILGTGLLGVTVNI